MRASLERWYAFVQQSHHVLRERPHLLFQQAANQPDSSPPASAARRRDRSGRDRRPWLKWLNKPTAAGRHRITLPVSADDCSFSPDGSRLLAGRAIWDVVTGSEQVALQGVSRDVAACAWSSDGLLVAGSDGTELRVWDAETGRISRTIPGRRLPIEKCAFAAPGRVVSLGLNRHGLPDRPGGELTVWDLERGSEIIGIEHPFHGHWDFALTADGSRLAFVSERRLNTIDLVEQVLLLDHSLAPSEIYFTCCAYGAGGRLYAGVWNQEASEAEGRPESEDYAALWALDDESGRVVEEFMRGPRPIRGCRTSDDGSRLLVNLGNATEVWDPDRRNRIAVFPGFSGGSLAGNGTVVALTGGAHGVEVTALDEENARAARKQAVRLSWYGGDGRRVRDASSALTAIASRGREPEVRFVAMFAADAALSPDGRTIARPWPEDVEPFPQHPEQTGIGIESSRTGHEIRLPYLRHQCRQLAFAPSGRTLGLLTWNGDLLVWDLDRPALARRLLDADLGLSCFAWTPDGRAVVAIANGRVRIVEVDTGVAGGGTAGLPDSTVRCVLSPDARLLAASAGFAAAAQVIVWDMRTASVVASRRIPDAHEVEFSPDGRHVLALARGMFHVLECPSLDERAAFAAPGRVFGLAASWAGQLLLLDARGSPLLELQNLPASTPVVTATHLFRIDTRDADPQATFRCPWCQARVDAPPSVIEAASAMRRASGEAATADTSHDPRLEARCSACAQPVRFTPFIA